ncbi:hypothetical protein J437_LFUL016435 [Ladona fulva]|uniref:YqaJ viral recombinase domain-containing protein n=1 Tax=Ladona fulva TaxID=123851 RepID=A0A8K0KMA5_LADFU|nr:hypothetical protein J437_LFUL016435 [Ladona fulva]
MNNVWFSERWKQLTASSFEHVCNLRKETSKEKVAQLILFPSFKRNKATDWSKIKEKASGNTVLPAGLFVPDDVPYLASSPDGVILGGEGLIEVKCPYNCRDLMPQEGVCRRIVKFMEEDQGNFMLRGRNAYYFKYSGNWKFAIKTFEITWCGLLMEL